MTDIDPASRALLGELRAPASAPPSDGAEREAMVGSLQQMIRDVPAQRAARHASQRSQWWVALPAAAVLLLAVGAAAWLMRPAAEPTQIADAPAPTGATLVAGNLLDEQGQALAAGDRFAGRGELHTPESQSALVLTPAGVQLTFAAATRATVPGSKDAQRFTLASGQLSLDVPPLPPGQKLSVVTSEATVTVHGTRFSVAYAGEGQTCVRVSEGRVSVERRGGEAEMLGAGDSSGCEVAVEPRTEGDARPARSSVPPASTLKEQNRLLGLGLAAEQSGDDAAAKRHLQTLVSRYPSSPLAAEARRALARLSRPD